MITSYVLTSRQLLASELDKELKKTPVVEYEIPKKIFTLPNGDNTLERLMSRVLDPPRVG